MGINHAEISIAYPRGSSFVERYNTCLKGKSRLLLTTIETKRWWDLLIDILAGLYFLPSHLVYNPLLFLHKKEPK